MSRMQRSNRRAEAAEDTSGIETTTVGVYRTAATIKGGRRFSFGSLVVAGDRNGSVGIGYGKATEVPPAIEKAEKEARRNMKRVQLHGGTIPHTVVGRFGASKVKLVPGSPGTGVVAGATVRSVLELAGVRDCLSKSYGSTNAKNLVKATLAGLAELRSKEQVEALRGVSLEETRVEQIVTRGAAFTGKGSARPGVALEVPASTSSSESESSDKAEASADGDSKPAAEEEVKAEGQETPEGGEQQGDDSSAKADEEKSGDSAG
ncbi:MAG: 30S ribosomal protein S5 [Planctomycetota bacterium]